MLFYFTRQPFITLTSAVLIFFAGRLALAAPAPLSGPGSENLITISAVGDIMIGTDYPTNRLPPDDGARFFEDAAPYIQAADIRFGNLEGTLYDGPPGSGAKSSGPNRYLFRTPTRFVRSFQKAGFNVMSLANNHSRDLGEEGLRSTMETLRGADIQYTGKHEGIAEFDIRGTHVAVIGADYYSNGRSVIKPERLFKEVRALKKKKDIVVVTAHVGAEGATADKVTFQDEIYLGENRGNPYEFAHQAIDAGADLVIMHGPHVPRGMEVYKGRLIAYSLGNFATANGVNISGTGGLAPLLRVQLNNKGEFKKGHLASFIQSRPDRVTYDKEQRALKMIKSLSLSQFKNSAPYFSDDGFLAPNTSTSVKPAP